MIDYDIGYMYFLDLYIYSDAVVNVFGIFVLSNIILAIIFLTSFCMWTYRAAGNAQTKNTKMITTTPGWAVLWYFVPFFNLWKPYLAMQDIWQLSESTNARSQVQTLQPFYAWWFSSALATVVAAWSTASVEWRLEGTAAYVKVLQLGLIAAPFFFISTLLTVWLVKQVTQMQVG